MECSKIYCCKIITKTNNIYVVLKKQTSFITLHFKLNYIYHIFLNIFIAIIGIQLIYNCIKDRYMKNYVYALKITSCISGIKVQ